MILIQRKFIVSNLINMQSNIHRAHIRRIISYLHYPNFWWLLLFFVGMGIFLIGMPKIIDDYWYMEFLRPWYMDQGIINPEYGGNIIKAGIPWDGIWETWKWRYEYDNIRLSNLLAPVLLLFPKWFGSGLCFLCFVYSVIEAFHLSGIKVKSSTVVPWTLLCLFLSLPWYNNFGSLVFQLNYIPACTFCIIIVKWVCRPKSDNYCSITALLLLGLITGAWQEAISVPLLCALIFKYIFYKESRKMTLAAIIGLICGVCFLMFSPGIQWRIGVEVKNHFQMNLPFFYLFFFRSWCVLAAIIVVIISLAIRKSRKNNQQKELFNIMAVMCVVSCAMSGYVAMTPRVGWLGYYISPFLLFGVLRSFSFSRPVWFRRTAKVSDIVVMIGLIWSLTLSSIQVIRLRGQLLAAIDQLAEVSNPFEFDHAYVDVSFLGNHSPLLSRMPLYHSEMASCYFKEYFDRNGPWSHLSLVPTVFKDFSPEKGTPIKGNDGFLKYKGELIRPFDGLEEGERGFTVEIDFGKGFVTATAIGAIFTNPNDGRRYIYVNPRLDWYMAHFKTIRGARNITFTDLPEYDRDDEK